MSIKIIETRPGHPDFHLFENLRHYFYPEGSIRFSLPDEVNTGLLVNCYVLADDHVPLGRLALYRNPDLSYEGKKAFCIGNYECNANTADALQLLNHAFAEAKRKGAEYLLGPMNGSTWDNYRFSLHHDHPEFFMEMYHHLYYNQQFLDAGFKPVAHYFSAIDRELKYDAPGMESKQGEFMDKGVRFRNIDLTNYETALERLYPFITEAFKTNFLYTPISKENFIEKYRDAKKVIDPEFVILAEDKGGELIGVFFCVNDILNKQEKSLIVKTIARNADKQWAGLGHVIGNELTKRCAQKGYASMVHAFLYDQGTSTKISKNFSGEIYKNYCLYGKAL